MTNIYVTAFPTSSGSGRVHGSRRGGDVLGCALAEDGTGIASHLSSSVAFAKHDMGITSDWKHEYYREHAPNGYELIWIDDPENDARWQAAMILNREKEAAAIRAGDESATNDPAVESVVGASNQ